MENEDENGGLQSIVRESKDCGENPNESPEESEKEESTAISYVQSLHSVFINIFK